MSPYALFPVKDCPPDTAAQGISDDDYVVGGEMSGAWIATTNVGAKTIDLPDATASGCRRINGRTGVGAYADELGRSHGYAALEYGPPLVDLNEHFQVENSEAADITAEGVIAGAAVFKRLKNWEAFWFDHEGGTTQRLGGLPGLPVSRSLGINAAREVVGYASNPAGLDLGDGGVYRPFMYHDGAMHKLADQQLVAWDINDHRDAVLSDPNAGVDDETAAIWTLWGTEEIAGPGATPAAVNNHRVVVGSAYDFNGIFAFVYRPGDAAVVNLNTVLDQDYGIYLLEANDINQHGHIACRGVDPSVQMTFGYVLVPTS